MTIATVIDTLCQRCGKRLRVAAAHVGKKARCPQCQAVYTVPERSTLSAAGCERISLPPSTGETWQLKSSDGLVYGPVSKDQLDCWHDEGRITRQSQLLPSAGQQWLWATDVYPGLEQAMPAKTAATQGPAETWQPRQPKLHAFYAGGIEPHHGPLVLAASIIGVVTLCAVPAMFGCALGLYDLRRMRIGKMDPAGRQFTIVGVTVGLVWTILNVGLLGTGLVAFLMH